MYCDVMVIYGLNIACMQDDVTVPKNAKPLKETDKATLTLNYINREFMWQKMAVRESDIDHVYILVGIGRLIQY